MSGTHNKDRANTKPGDLRAEMSKRVGTFIYLLIYDELVDRSKYRRSARSSGRTTRVRGPDWEVDG